jgi:hypothetical protein
MQKLLLLDEVASILRVELDEVSRLIEADQLDVVEIAPDARRVHPAALQRFIHVRRRQFRPFAESRVESSA